MKLSRCCLLALLMIPACSSPYGRVTSVENLARLQGGSLSTVWYYGSDNRYHYFRHLWKSSTPYRLHREDITWQPEETFDGYDRCVLVARQLREHLNAEAPQGITIEN